MHNTHYPHINRTVWSMQLVVIVNVARVRDRIGETQIALDFAVGGHRGWGRESRAGRDTEEIIAGKSTKKYV